jgi:DNA-binding LacI/PurR family transcriptional regulator
VIDGIEDVATQAGYRILICKSNESYENEVRNTSALVFHRVDGLLISLAKDTRDVDHLLTAHRKGTPVVLFDRVSEKMDVSKVVVDDAEGAFTMVEHLISAGYRHIAHLAGPAILGVSKNRKKGYLKALKKHGIAINEHMIVEGNMDLTSGYQGALALLSLPKLPDAIFAANDQVAMGAMKAIREKKLRIPSDIALAGFSNEPLTSLTEPALTTVNQPAFEIGQAACNLLIRKMEKKPGSSKAETVVLKTSLVKRQST